MKKVLAVIALTLSASALVACGGGSSSSSTATTGAATTGGGAKTTLQLSADPSGAPKYNTDKLTAKAGTVEIDFTNTSGVKHNVAIKDPAGKVYGFTPHVITKGTESFTLNLPAGTYIYFSTVRNQEPAGMMGTLTVK